MLTTTPKAHVWVPGWRRAAPNVGGNARRRRSMRGWGGFVGRGSYSRSMFSAQARVSVRFLGMADLFGGVVGEEGWSWWKPLFGAASTTSASLPSRDHHRAIIYLVFTQRLREGAAIHRWAFGMVGATSSYCSLPKATLRASTRCM